MPIRSRLAASAVLCSVILAGACSARPAAPPPVSADAWAVVDGREIKRADVEKAYRRVADPAARPSEDEIMAAKLSLLNEMITQDLLLAKAKALGIEATGAEIEKAFEERRRSVADDVLQKQLKDRGLTTDDVKDDLRKELTTQKVIEREVDAKVNVDEKAIADFFTANKAQFNLPEPAYRLAQIVITPVRDPQINNRQNDDATTPEAASRKAKMLSDRLRGGGQFSELAMDYSEDPQSAPQGGDLGLVSQSQLQQAGAPFRDAVLKAQPGTISQVSAGGGHTLVLLVAKEPAGQRDLTTPGVRDNIREMLRDRQQQLLQAAYLAVLRNDAKVDNLLAKQVVNRPAAPPSIAPAAPGKK